MARIVHLTTVHRLRDPRIFYKEVMSLQRAGHDVHLVAQHDRSEVVEGVPVAALTPVRGRWSRLALQRRAYVRARDLRADVYHVHDPEALPLARVLKRSTGARIVYDMHENYGGRPGAEGLVLRALERWCFGWVDHVVLAEACYAHRLRGHDVPSTELLNYALPRPTPPPARPVTDGALRLLYTGVMADVRGLPTLLRLGRALREMEGPWRLDLVGVCYLDADRRRAEALLDELDAGEVVRRVGWDAYVPAPAMAPYYAEAHVGLALLEPDPNHGDPPTKFYEYLSWGLPILCTDLPQWRAFVETHGCGAAVPPGDVAAAVRVLRRWAGEPGAYERLAANARRAAPRFLWPVMEARLLALYDDLLARPPR